MRCTRSLASSDTGTLSGNEYAFDRMRLYVCLMSVVSKGGLPTSIVYRITPMDHTSTSKLWPHLPSSTSGAM
jgi:hypothetical protein